MKYCIVVDKCVSTIKHKSFQGHSLLLVRPLGQSKNNIIAVDLVGCSIGEYVIVTMGGSARMALGSNASVVDAAIVGIIDNYNKLENKEAVL